MKPIGSPPLQPFITLTTSNYRKFRLISIPWTNASLTDCSQGFDGRESLVPPQLLPFSPTLEFAVTWRCLIVFQKRRKSAEYGSFLGRTLGYSWGVSGFSFSLGIGLGSGLGLGLGLRFSYVCGHYRDTSGNYQVVYRVICIRFATLESFLFIRHPRRQWYNRNGSVYRWLMFY